MKNRIFVFTLLFIFIGVKSTQAQSKLGYIDEGYVLEKTPEYKKVQEEMKTYEKQVKPELESKENEYKKKAKELDSLARIKTTPPIILQTKYQELQQFQQEIIEFEKALQQEYQSELAKKMKPVYEKLQNAINSASQDLGGTYIFRKEALVFEVEENNVSDLVLKKLGVSVSSVAGRGNLKDQNKIGVFDVNYVAPQLPEYKQAEASLKVYQDQLRKNVEGLQQKLQGVMQQLDPKNPTPTSDAKKEELAQEGQKLQEQIVASQQNAQGQYQKKYNDLLEPILKKIEAKLKEVAKENSYTYVFRIESTLKEPETSNISDLVLKKLGVTPTKTNE